MIRRFALIWIASVVCLAGCPKSGERTIEPGGDTRVLGTFAGMVTYLENEKLAELESVEFWESEYGSGLKLTTAHYEILTTLFEPLILRQVPRFMESAWRGYNDQLPEPIETANKFTVYLFDNRRQWVDFTRGFTGKQAELFCKIKAGAYYHNGACVTYNIGRSRTFSALGHEGWHQFTGRHFEFRLPSWLDEGIAMLFEEPRAVGRRFEFDPDWNLYRLEGLAKVLGKGKMIRLKELLAINPGQVLTTDEAEAVTAFYSQSYALVRFLREGGYGARLGNYRRLLLDGLRGDWPLDEVSKRIARDRNIPRTILWNRIVGVGLFERYVGGDFEQIERQYLAYCRGIVRD